MNQNSPHPASARDAIVVSGVGVVCAAGTTPDALFDACCAGRSTAAWREYAASDGSVRLPVCAAPDPDATGVWPGGAWRLAGLDRGIALALGAASGAWRDAGLHVEETLLPVPEWRVGLVVGTSRGAVGPVCEVADAIAGRGRVRARHAASTGVASFSGALAQAFPIRGPAFTVSGTCASGALAIATGAALLASGAVDLALVGGADASLLPATALPLARAGVLGWDADPVRACRPFDRRRNGMLLGEGAAFLVIERIDQARRRGARVRGRLLGWSTGSERSGRTGIDPQGEGLSRVLGEALERGGVAPAELDYINAHGTGTPANDLAEARVVARLSRAAGRPIPCSSTKPIAGHCLGGAAALEAAICLEALARGVIPPTANCSEPDPACEIDAVGEGPRPAAVHRVASLSLGFWGTLGALVFGGSESSLARECVGGNRGL
jgi:3-oxoacyl-[acyl-carrier-protein] synthase II